MAAKGLQLQEYCMSASPPLDSHCPVLIAALAETEQIHLCRNAKLRLVLE